MMNDYRPYIIDVRNIKKRIRVYRDYIKRHRHNIDNYDRIINDMYSNMPEDIMLDKFADNINTTKNIIYIMKHGIDKNMKKLILLSGDCDELNELLLEYNKFNDSVNRILKNIAFILTDENVIRMLKIKNNARFIDEVDRFCDNMHVDSISLNEIVSNENYKKLKILRTKIMNSSQKIRKLLFLIDNRIHEYESKNDSRYIQFKSYPN